MILPNKGRGEKPSFWDTNPILFSLVTQSVTTRPSRNVPELKTLGHTSWQVSIQGHFISEHKSSVTVINTVSPKWSDPICRGLWAKHVFTSAYQLSETALLSSVEFGLRWLDKHQDLLPKLFHVNRYIAWINMIFILTYWNKDNFK